MSPLRASGFLSAVAVVGTWTGSVHATDCDATPVCWWHCRPRVTCYPATPCSPGGCYYEPPCGPIRRLLGLCRPVPIVACQPTCAAPCAPPPCASCGGTAAPVIAAPAPAAVPTPAPAPEVPHYSPPPATGSSYQPQRLPVQPPAPVRLDRFVSFPGER
jgi:hypothetical protein